MSSSYWAEERDAGKFRSSVLLDPIYGFGGDGKGANRMPLHRPFVLPLG